MLNSDEIKKLAMVKRVKDYYTADNEFRNDFNNNPKNALKNKGIEVDTGYLYFLENSEKLSIDEKKNNLYSQAVDKWYLDVHKKIDSFTNTDAYNCKKLFEHKDIIRKRLILENLMYKKQVYIHYFPIMFELSKGCSMQCNFCAIDAKPFESNFEYNEENARLFKEIVSISKRVIGDVVATCSCYYATEPLDNPDYESFVKDFKEITGRFPQITTVCADLYPDRIRKYMDLIGYEELYYAGLRFSIRTLGQFKKIMKKYSPEELAFIEVIANNPESTNAYANCGRVRSGIKSGRLKYSTDKAILNYTISCLNGFRVNLVDKKITYEIPSTPNDNIPDGYEVLDTKYFTDSKDFEEKLLQMIEEDVHVNLPDFGYITLNPKVDISYETLKIVLTGDKSGCKVIYTDNIKKWLELLKSNLVAIKDVKTEKIEDITWITIDNLYKKGYIKWYKDSF